MLFHLKLQFEFILNMRLIENYLHDLVRKKKSSYHMHSIDGSRWVMIWIRIKWTWTICLIIISQRKKEKKSYFFNLEYHSSLRSVELNVATILSVGHPSTNDLSLSRVVSETSSRHVANHSSHTRIRLFSLKVVLDLFDKERSTWRSFIDHVFD